MEGSLEDAAYLTRSENRVADMELLAERPRDRDAIKEATGVSRVTVGRMLGELEDRGWIGREGHEYRITESGRIVTEDLMQLLEATSTAQKLRDVEPLLPIDEFDFDLRRFAEADVRRPKRSDPSAHMRRMAELFADSTTVRVVAPSVSPLPVRAHRDRVLESDAHDAVVVFTGDAPGVATGDPEISSLFREMATTGRFQGYRHGGASPIDIVVIDRTVMLTLYDDSGAGFHSVIESKDDAVYAWAVSEFERYVAEADRLGVEAFSGERAERR
jgi:predicted transcriptional regulator